MGILDIRGGGLLGNALYGFSNGYFGRVGTVLVWGFLFLLAVASLLASCVWAYDACQKYKNRFC